MTIKEFNQIKAAAFAAAKEAPEVNEALKYGDCYIYELTQLPDKHGVLTLNYKTQLNDLTIKTAGFEPEKTDIKLIMHLNRSTKCAEF